MSLDRMQEHELSLYFLNTFKKGAHLMISGNLFQCLGPIHIMELERHVF